MKNGIKKIQAAAYNSARTIIFKEQSTLKIRFPEGICAKKIGIHFSYLISWHLFEFFECQTGHLLSLKKTQINRTLKTWNPSPPPTRPPNFQTFHHTWNIKFKIHHALKYMVCMTCMYLLIRCLMVSTNQADSRCFYFRISWILMEWRWFYFFPPLHLVQGLRSNNIK